MKYTRMIRAEESVEDSYERNKALSGFEERIDKLTPKQMKVALRYILSGKSLTKAVTLAENHPKR